jgi:HemY protein
MIRLILFLVLLVAIGLGFTWLADRPGEVAITWQGNTYILDLLTMAVAVLALIVAVMVSWAIIRTVLDSPFIMQRFFRRRSKEQGYKALSSGFIAAGSGDAETARRMSVRADRMLDDEPLTRLLKAQTALLEDKHDEAKTQFEDMLDDEKTRLLGLRGLYLEAAQEEDGLAARQYAEKASSLEPRLGWAGKARQEFAASSGEWHEALEALDANKSNRIIDKDTAKRQRAVLLTANAKSIELSEPKLARKQALEATKLAPDLVPAGLTAGRVMVRLGEVRSASKLLETLWKSRPHPEVADAYLHVRPGDSAVDRLKRARSLEAIRPNHPESHFTIGRAALEAKEFDQARAAAAALLKTRPSERAFLLMADIEDAEFGDDGRIREWLARAVHAPRDATWVADGVTSDEWAPVSPVTGKIDAFQWKVPPSTVEPKEMPSIDWDAQSEDVSRRRALLAAPVATATVAEVTDVKDESAVDATAETKDADAETADTAITETSTVTDDVQVQSNTPTKAKVEVVEASVVEVVSKVEDLPKPEGDPVVAEVEAKASEAPGKAEARAAIAGSGIEAETPAARKPDVISHPRSEDKIVAETDEGERIIGNRPDDPGVRPDAKPEKSGGFKFFG